MFEHIPTPIAFAVSITLIVTMIICGFTIKIDMDTQSYCNDAVHEFVDKSRSVGYISPNAYTEMMQKFGYTGNLYKITIMHQSQRSVPKADVDAKGKETIKEDKFADAYNTYYEDEILEYMFPSSGSDREYELKNGDYLKVSFKLKEPTLGAKILGMFTTGEYMTISGAYGGYVGSLEEK